MTVEKRARMDIRTISIAFAVLLIGLASFGKVSAQEKAPDFTLTDIDGNEFSIADFSGKTVVLSFVATRVVFSKMQVCVLVNVSKSMGDDVAIILIGASTHTLEIGGDTKEELRKFRDDCGFEGVVAADTKGVAEDYNVTYIPTLFIIDQAGYIRHKHLGVVDAREQVLLKELQAIVPEFSSPVILLFVAVSVTLVIVLLNQRAKSDGRIQRLIGRHGQD